MIKWDLTREDDALIRAIADRYMALMKEMGAPRFDDKTGVVMDITAVHLNGTPLNLDSLLKAENNDFMHDVTGIRFNLDKKTGTLMNCFDPRYAR
ncbi:MAG: hypothetical protein WC359_12515 [Dehalococcoidia bacterium]|jgi:hypothetical protein